MNIFKDEEQAEILSVKINKIGFAVNYEIKDNHITAILKKTERYKGGFDLEKWKVTLANHIQPNLVENKTVSIEYA